jgi:hypothetical protein
VLRSRLLRARYSLKDCRATAETLWGTASQAAEKLQYCHSEGGFCPRNLFFLAFVKKQFPRCARDDKKVDVEDQV